MTKIKNQVAYKLKSVLNGHDYFPLTNSESNYPGLLKDQTISAELDAVRDFVISGLSPIYGGELKITEIEYNGELTSPSAVANALNPTYAVAQYELLFLDLNGHQYLLKTPNVTIGAGGVTLTDDDFIDFPVNQGEQGETGNGIESIVLQSTVGLVKTYRITFTDATTFDFEVSNGAQGDAGDAGDAGDNGLNADVTRTSTTSIAIASSGSKTLNYTASTNLGWLVGTRLRFANSISNYMEGAVTAVSSTSVTIDVDNSSGSGTLASWNISIAGDKGTDASTVNLQKTITYPGDFTGSDYTLTSADDNYTIIVDNGAQDVTITVDTSLSAKFVAGFIQKGTGDVTFVEDGTNIETPIGLLIKGENYAVALEKEGSTTTHYLLGNTKA